ncbi:hypothetical protein K8T06_09870 [bacterium]|nr:hypothetical protein [bacterium]
MTPEHPGGWRWLNSRTLQFTPAQPWPAYSTFKIKAGRASTTLNTVLPAPIRTEPVHGVTDALPVETIKLIFPSPVNVDSLAEHIELYFWDAPAADGKPRQILDNEHFAVKRIGQNNSWGEASYLLTFLKPVPNSTRVKLFMDLTDQREEKSRFVLDFTISRHFSVLAVGAGDSWMPVSFRGGYDDSVEPLSLNTNPPVLNLRMSSVPELVTPGAFFDLIHLAPAVPDMKFRIKNRIVEITGKFVPDTVYTATLRPTEMLEDNRGRKLHLENAVEFEFVFKKPGTMLEWERGMAVIERYGSKMLPLRGRGNQVADLRIYRIDPLDRTLWPFNSTDVSTDPDKRPPRAFQNKEYHDQARYSDTWQLEQTLKTMGSPHISELVDLPLNPMGHGAIYGVDVAGYLQQIDGKNVPGTYLAGIQSVDDHGLRKWMRFQVTDLAITTIEEPDQVTFLVTSLSSARPVAKAKITVEGFGNGEWKRLFSGKTDVMGICVFAQPKQNNYIRVKRIRVERGNDILVCDADNPPQIFRNGHWNQEGDWLFSVVNYPSNTHRKSIIGHVFSDRPVYKPSDPVHIRGWIRRRNTGTFSKPAGNVTIVVDGPGGMTWNETVKLSGYGGFYLEFQQETAPAGSYTVRVNSSNNYACDCTFEMEDYRIPRFEVLLHGPDTTSLDAAFDVSMTASYYAGGAMVERPVNWQVTQHPVRWNSAVLPGFRFADDDTFSSRPGLREEDVLNRRTETDKTGADRITINPLEDPSLETRVYVVEATVTGIDDQTVTAVKKIKATPAFMLGLKVPRVLEPGEQVKSEIAILDAENIFQVDHDVLVRLIHRTWHTVLKAGNYGTGDIKYDTHIVETIVDKKTVTSKNTLLEVVFPAREAGVYVIEASARDRLGRAQVVSMDIFVQGDSAVTWERPSDRRFTVKTSKKIYKPGETAEIILESPFQTAEAVAVVESRDKTRLIHCSVRNGTGIIRLPVKNDWCPGIPVSILLMRGRLTNSRLDSLTGIDLGKPQTLGASLQLNVSDAGYRIKIDVEHPEKALPGEKIDLSLILTDENNRPLSGEAAVWLVDRAVLALGRETNVDPLSDMLKKWQSYAGIRDTREFTVGKLPCVEKPGGGYGAALGADLSVFDRLSLRKNFKAVPFYDPFVEIGDNGKAKVTVELPDNLTQFAIKVKAASGINRFGFANSRLSVRLPLVMQPTVPRFIRPGDKFAALGISRLVEGDAEAGRVTVAADGLKIIGDAAREIYWEPNIPVRTSFMLDTPEAEYEENGRLVLDEISIRLAAERLSDGIGDASEITVPVWDGARLWVENQDMTLETGAIIEIPSINMTEIRAETAHRSIRISTNPLMALALQAESMLGNYPYGCTEQRVSRASGFIAMKVLAGTLQKETSAHYDVTIQETADYLPAIISPEGLAAFWPGGKGYVHLSARVLRFLVDARMAGFDVDPLVVQQLSRALDAALRSDSEFLLSEYAITERCLALEALFILGETDSAYLEELARQADSLGLESRARITRLLALQDGVDPGKIDALVEGLLADVITKSVNGRIVATGLRQTNSLYRPRIFHTDITALAEIIRTLLVVAPDDPRIVSLADGMANMLSSGTMTTYHADTLLLVLRDMLNFHSEEKTAEIVIGTKQISIGGDNPLVVIVDNGSEKLNLELKSGSSLTVQIETRGYPVLSSALLPGESRGFAVNRIWRLVDETGHAGKKLDLNEAGKTISIDLGVIVEEHIQVINAEDRNYVVVKIPLAAGMEPLNPNLAISPPEATSDGILTKSPDYMELRDDYAAYYYNDLPRGSYDFYFRTRVSFSGSFSQPGAWATMMYNMEETGASPGATITISSVD